MLQGPLPDFSPPLVAILRGIKPGEALPVGEALVGAGIRVMEVTLNSPDPLSSIKALSEKTDPSVYVGAGTVLAPKEVDEVRKAGGSLIVSPNLDTRVVKRTKELDMVSVPGCMTPTEVIEAVRAGADMVKLFPGEVISPAAVRALRAVVPAKRRGDSARFIVTGGVSLDNMEDYFAAGAYGVGLGSALYRPGKTAEEVGADAARFVKKYNSIMEERSNKG